MGRINISMKHTQAHDYLRRLTTSVIRRAGEVQHLTSTYNLCRHKQPLVTPIVDGASQIKVGVGDMNTTIYKRAPLACLGMLKKINRFL